MRILPLFFLIILFLPLSSAEVAGISDISDLYEFDVANIGANVSFFADDSDHNGQYDSVSSKVSLNESGEFILSFDLLKNGSFQSHSTTAISNNYSGDIGRVLSGDYEIIVTISAASEEFDGVLFRNAFFFQSSQF